MHTLAARNSVASDEIVQLIFKNFVIAHTPKDSQRDVFAEPWIPYLQFIRLYVVAAIRNWQVLRAHRNRRQAPLAFEQLCA